MSTLRPGSHPIALLLLLSVAAAAAAPACVCFRPPGASKGAEWSGAERPAAGEETVVLGPARLALLEAARELADELTEPEYRLMAYEAVADAYFEAGDQERLAELAAAALETITEGADVFSGGAEYEDGGYELLDAYSTMLWGAGLCEDLIALGEGATAYLEETLAVVAEVCARDGELDRALTTLGRLEDDGLRAATILGILEALEEAESPPAGALDRVAVRAAEVEDREARRRVQIALVEAYAAKKDTRMMERLVDRARHGLAEAAPAERVLALGRLARAYRGADRPREATLLLDEALMAGAEITDMPLTSYRPLIPLAVALGRTEQLVAASERWSHPAARVGLLRALAAAQAAAGAASDASLWSLAIVAAGSVEGAEERAALTVGLAQWALLERRDADARAQVAAVRALYDALEDERARASLRLPLIDVAVALGDLAQADTLIAQEESEQGRDALQARVIRVLLRSIGDTREAARRVETIGALAVRASALTGLAEHQSVSGDATAAERFRRAWDLARAGADDTMWATDAVDTIAAWHARSGRPDVAVETLLAVPGASAKVGALVDLALAGVGPKDPVGPRLELMLQALVAAGRAEAGLEHSEGECPDEDCDLYCEESYGHDWGHDGEDCDLDFDECVEECDYGYEECADLCGEDDEDCVDACDEGAAECESECEGAYEECLDGALLDLGPARARRTARRARAAAHRTLAHQRADRRHRRPAKRARPALATYDAGGERPAARERHADRPADPSAAPAAAPPPPAAADALPGAGADARAGAPGGRAAPLGTPAHSGGGPAAAPAALGPAR